jgi:hypothetical protein
MLAHSYSEGVTAPLSLRLRVPGTNWWIVATPTDGPEWDLQVMDHLSEAPTGPHAHILARQWLNEVLSDLRQQVWTELLRLQGSEK